ETFQNRIEIAVEVLVLVFGVELAEQLRSHAGGPTTFGSNSVRSRTDLSPEVPPGHDGLRSRPDLGSEVTRGLRGAAWTGLVKLGGGARSSVALGELPICLANPLAGGIDRARRRPLLRLVRATKPGHRP